MSEQSLCSVNKVIIRKAGVTDILELFKLVDLFDSFEIDRDKTKLNLREMLYNSGVWLATYNDVVIGGSAAYVMPCMFNSDVLFCVMFFFVKKEYRALTKQIIQELEVVLIQSHVTKLIFGFLAQDLNAKKYVRFMRMLGYRVFETHVFKTI